MFYLEVQIVQIVRKNLDDEIIEEISLMYELFRLISLFMIDSAHLNERIQLALDFVRHEANLAHRIETRIARVYNRLVVKLGYHHVSRVH
jgi:hypothetical protein